VLSSVVLIQYRRVTDSHIHDHAYRVFQKMDPWFILTITSVNMDNHFFTVTTRNLRCTKIKLFQPPHLYYVATLPYFTEVIVKINQGVRFLEHPVYRASVVSCGIPVCSFRGL